MKSYTGIGRGNTTDAIKEATNGLNNPKFILVMTAIEEIEIASELLMEKYPNVDVMGVSGSSFNNGNIIDSSNFSGNERQNIVHVIALFDDAEISCGIMDRLDTAPLYNIKEFDSNLKKISPGSNNTVCISFTTDYEETFVSTAKIVLEKKNIPLVGGSVAGAYTKDMDPFVVLNGKKYYHASAYVFIKNTVGKIKTYRNDTYEKNSKQVMQITKVAKTKEQRTIIDVDGKKLSDLYEKKYGTKGKEIENNAFNLTINKPIGVVIGNQTYVISIKSLNSDGSVDTFKKVYEGGSLTFMEMGDYEAMEKNLVKRIKEEMGNISFVFSVDCIYRYYVYSQNKFLDTYLDGMKKIGNHVGIIGLGEQNEHQHFNQTMVCAVFE